MLNKNDIKFYLKVTGILLLPIFFAYCLSLFLSLAEEKPKSTKNFQVEKSVEKSEKELEQEINALLKQHNLSLNTPLDELFDEIFDRWMESPQNAQTLEQLANELSEKIEKSPYKDQLQIPALKDVTWSDEQWAALKQNNQHPLDISLEYCVEQNFEAIGNCVLSHIQLWEKNIKTSYDVIVAKTKGKTQKDFIAAQASWQEHVMAEQKLAESFLPTTGSAQKIKEAKTKLLFDILQRIKERALTLEAMQQQIQ